MTADEQEAQSFRYVAPRIFRLSSGNIALCPMIGREPIRILTPEEFDLIFIPTMTDLETAHRMSEAAQRARADAMNSPSPRAAPRKTELDDLA